MDKDSQATIAQQPILRVGVTGHRPNKLAGADTDRLQMRIGVLLDRLADLAKKISVGKISAGIGDGPSSPGRDGATGRRFTTALAAGADCLAADAAIAGGYDLDLVLPFPRETYIRSQGFSPAELRTFLRLWTHAPETTTRMELDAGHDSGGASAYVALAHAILERSDVLLGVWNGQKGDGPGGTAEVLADAMARGHVVVWLDLDGSFRLWDPDGKRWQALDFDNPGDPGAMHLDKRIQALFDR